MNEYKILIVEDEKQIARFLQLELMHEGYEVETVYDGREGFEKIKNNEYNLIILDVMLPSLNGMEVCRRVRAFSEVPIIMLTAKDSVIDKVTGLDIGADDYMTKPFAIEELLARIRAVKRKNSSKNNENKNEIMVNDLVMNLSTHEVRRGDKLIELTKREYDLLEYLMKNVDVVLNREQLLEVVWGYNYMGDTNVVDVYIRYLRSKIDEEFDVKLIHTVRGVGYVIKKHKNID
ncbi:MAG: response regulator transcription factor [Clostridium argentinense]|uniref:Stage 0 sporulation protein A homolog n=1 Tax=Clostridium faecium TaxID=2762223 RepID=A0ABR8YSY4_9CLOT|nr:MULTISPECIES: response regulator transcription factor [Clostridium]MBD8047356.1 response regulator transcription factor [Clostridium faecium]MBS5823566.1 response regulator transcription factor [Clostridium argentinense]MDU1350264.1 response regulator transcription factor [Clostridium argentinense]